MHWGKNYDNIFNNSDTQRSVIDSHTSFNSIVRTMLIIARQILFDMNEFDNRMLSYLPINVFEYTHRLMSLMSLPINGFDFAADRRILYEYFLVN